MGFTKKPCPACGEVYSHRKADEICYRCKKLIKEAMDNREKVLADPGLVPARLGRAPHWNETYYHRGEWKDVEVTALAIWELADAITVPDPEHKAGWKDGLLGKVDGGSQSSCVLVEKEAGECLKRLNKSIHVIVRNAYRSGFADGHNLLGRLATGDVTINEFYSRSEHKY